MSSAADPGPRKAESFSPEERQRVHRAHQRLRNASQALESLIATEPIRGRWAPEPAPTEALDGARGEFERAYRAVNDCHGELLGWKVPAVED